jgi:hypothetical protein
MSQKELLLISITIFLTIIAWMMIDIYKVKQETGVEAKNNTSSIVNFQLDPKVFNSLKTKQP